ncbi:hypothetical protein JOE21_001197 [Desmospora profundinema]|uniref:XRE family transcriptional regulator n=1 Tax=Desmospora profundinema TaxID=1571184 RepID=A0ABU1IKB1_9BACL|nr:hypothetical protein [Desmospora profundinema]
MAFGSDTPWVRLNHPLLKHLREKEGLSIESGRRLG